MNKDFKHRQPASKPRGSGLLLGLFVGFLLGLAAAAAIAIYVFKTPMPFNNKNAAPAKPGEKAPDAGTLGKAGKAEDGKVAVRNIRRKAKESLDKAIKDGDMGEDEGDRLLKELDKVTKQTTDELDALLETKQKEIMEV